jgi:phage shock protein PspC (stress-responsive transcriptional regulator)
MAIQIRDEESIFGRPLRRSRKKRMIAGVCGGLADWLESDATVIRVFFVVATVLMGIFPGVLVYGALWLAVPEARNPRVRVRVWDQWDELEEIDL